MGKESHKNKIKTIIQITLSNIKSNIWTNNEGINHFGASLQGFNGKLLRVDIKLVFDIFECIWTSKSSLVEEAIDGFFAMIYQDLLN